jgi:hypothetical protein
MRLKDHTRERGLTGEEAAVSTAAEDIVPKHFIFMAWYVV